MSDWGFVGQAYTASNPDQDSQELINWFLEVSQDERSKEKKTLLGVPGKLALLTLSGQGRGGWVLPGDQQALVVMGSSVYLLTITTPATATTAAVLSSTLIGSIGSSTGQVCIRDNASGGVAVIVDGTSSGYVYNIASQTLTTVSGGGFYGADRLAFVDGWLIFNKPGTQIFYTSPLYWNGVDAFDPTYFALKDSSSDNLVTLCESLREVWLIGERTTEIWYDAGNQYFPFSRLQGISLQIGCAAKHSVTRFGPGLAWLAKSERGQNVVVATEGYQHSVISTEAVSNAINSYLVVDDAFAYSYSEGGHTFYVITFPTADVTWTYDAASKSWHKRMSYDPVSGVGHRDRANFYINFANQRIVGDYTNGKVYAMSRAYYSDDAYPLVALRRTAHVWDGSMRERLFHGQIQVQFRAGQGLANGQGSDPQMMLRWSDDNCQTWSNQRQVPIGKMGETKSRAISRRLGQSRDRVYEVSISDPVNRDIVGASLDVS